MWEQWLSWGVTVLNVSVAILWWRMKVKSERNIARCHRLLASVDQLHAKTLVNLANQRAEAIAHDLTVGLIEHQGKS